MINNYNYIICVIIITFQWVCGQEPPVEFQYNQSTLQAFYFFTDVTLNGTPIESDDWVAAFNGDVCVGARQWDTSNCGGGICDVPIMGNDGSEITAGYMQNGDIPMFKIYDTSSGNYYDAIPPEIVDPWAISFFSINDLLEATWSINFADFQYNGSITSEVHINGVAIGSEEDMLAAFVNGEIRGVVNGLESPFGNIVFPIMIYSNESSGETLEFIYYDSSSNLYLQLIETLEFISDMTEGTAVNPFIFTITSDDIGGCTDSSACNYNGGATDDDGSCEYALTNFDCDDNCTVNIDCLGECGGSGYADNCGACDSDSSNDCEQDACGTWGGDVGDADGDGLCDTDDAEPDCATNDTDSCGECGGNEFNTSNCLRIDTHYVNNFSINSIYPNPFNPVVNIDLSIDIVGHLQLSVFTIEGIQIKTIYNGPSFAGESTFTWRPENRASGVYFISAVIDDQVKTQKLLFLK
mgnify:CR=1 FL=1